MKVTAPGTPAARSLREVCEAARQANCGECWARPGDECVFTSVPVSVPVTPGTPVSRPAATTWPGSPGPCAAASSRDRT